MITFKVLDYFIIILFFSITLFNGICVYKKDAQDFFLSSKTNLWLLLILKVNLDLKFHELQSEYVVCKIK